MYVYGLGLAYAVSGSLIEVYHADRLGSVRALTYGSGTLIASYRSDEWGIPTASTGTSSQPFTFTGEPGDATGLSYLRARYYDPNLGRFTGQDTWTGSLASSVTQNRYAYASTYCERPSLVENLILRGSRLMIINALSSRCSRCSWNISLSD